MKKLFTLLFVFGTFTSVFAQYDRDSKNTRPDRNDNNSGYDSRNGNGNYSKPGAGAVNDGRNNNGKDYAYDNRRDHNNYSMSSRDKDFRIQKISREYDYRISAVSANRYLRSRERRYQIEDLQKQKYAEIRNVEAMYRDSRNRW